MDPNAQHITPIDLSALSGADREVVERLDRELAPLAGQAPGRPFALESLREALEALRGAGAGLPAEDPRRMALDALREPAALEQLSRLATSFGRGRITRELHERVEGLAREHRAQLRRQFSGLEAA